MWSLASRSASRASSSWPAAWSASASTSRTSPLRVVRSPALASAAHGGARGDQRLARRPLREPNASERRLDRGPRHPRLTEDGDRRVHVAFRRRHVAARERDHGEVRQRRALHETVALRPAREERAHHELLRVVELPRVVRGESELHARRRLHVVQAEPLGARQRRAQEGHRAAVGSELVQAEADHDAQVACVALVAGRLERGDRLVAEPDARHLVPAHRERLVDVARGLRGRRLRTAHRLDAREETVRVIEHAHVAELDRGPRPRDPRRVELEARVRSEQRLCDRHEGLAMAQLPAGGGGLGGGAKPLGGPGAESLHRIGGVLLGLVVLAAPLVRLRPEQGQAAELFSVRARGDGQPHALEHRGGVVAFERELRGAAIPVHGAAPASRRRRSGARARWRRCAPRLRGSAPRGRGPAFGRPPSTSRRRPRGADRDGRRTPTRRSLAARAAAATSSPSHPSSPSLVPISSATPSLRKAPPNTLAARRTRRASPSIRSSAA